MEEGQDRRRRRRNYDLLETESLSSFSVRCEMSV